MSRLGIKIVLATIVLTLLFSRGYAQDVVNDFQSRYAVGISYKFNKKWKISAEPEARFDENFSIDKFLVEGKLRYKPIKILSIAAIYRFEVNYRDVKATQYLNRFAFSAAVGKKFKRFEPAFRLMYSNYADDEISNGDYLRYKVLLAYNIKDCKLTPLVGFEMFQQLGRNSFLYKLRYTAALDYKINKKNAVGLSYKFDYYEYEYLNKHIVSLGYKFKF